MLLPRIIPTLLVHKNGLVKSEQFTNYKYVGDPLNAVKIFNEKEVDEIIVLDIDASRYNNEPDYKLIENLATECRMPLCYGGGIKNVEQAARIFGLGVEKIAISSAAIETPALITQIAERVGNQSVVVVLDVLKVGDKYEIVTRNATVRTGISPIDFVTRIRSMGVGEIVINAVHKDGMLSGYDYQLIDQIRALINIPMTILGGAGTYADIVKAIQRYKIIGIAAGSLFVFKGKFKAVLISYPSAAQKEGFYMEAFSMGSITPSIESLSQKN